MVKDGSEQTELSFNASPFPSSSGADNNFEVSIGGIYFSYNSGVTKSS